MTNPTEINTSTLNGPHFSPIKRVCVCDTQPVTAEGVRTLLGGSAGSGFAEATDSLAQATELVRRAPPPTFLCWTKPSGIQADPGMAHRSKRPTKWPLTPTAIVVWGVSVTEAEAPRFLQAGAKGILRKTATIPVVLACLRTVALGRSWMEDCVFRDSSRADRYPRSELTSREQQVLELVEQGFKNKEIANDLGIRPGTVKNPPEAHFPRKPASEVRYGLALSGLMDRGLVSIPV